MMRVTSGAAAKQKLLQPGFLLVSCAVLFNFALCFSNTVGVLKASNALVILAEATQLGVALLIIHRHTAPIMPTVITLMLYLLSMKLFNPELDLKIIRDLAIMYIFFVLGRGSTSRTVSLTLWTTIAVVLLVAGFEFLATDAYGRLFNVWAYYVDKGALADDLVNYGNTSLFLSANRGEEIGRNFFPGVFGSHRISSVFLEPDSMGNFAGILFAWGLSGRFSCRLERGLLLAVALFCVVLGDSRFAAGCCALMLLLRLSKAWRSPAVAFFIPVALMLGLVIFGVVTELPGQAPIITSDDFLGRLMFSGRLLAYWTWPEWFALRPSSVYVADTGYAYVINSLGLLPALILLGAFALTRPTTEEAACMKAMTSLYIATALSIGASVFTIKTGGLVWFLCGAAMALPKPTRGLLVEHDSSAAAQLSWS